MKALVLKDLYNLKANIRSVLIMWLLLSFLVGTSSVESYLVMVTTMIGLMSAVSTFSYDDHCHWNRYALIMPVEKQEIVRAKYVTLLCFTLFGLCYGIFAAVLGGVLTRSFTFDIGSIMAVLLMLPAAFSVTMVVGSVSIVFVYRFGVEKARLIMVFAAAIPIGILFGLYWITAELLGIVFTDALTIALVCISPLPALLFSYGSYRISAGIFEKQEF